MCGSVMNCPVYAAEAVPWSPAGEWQLVYDDGRRAEACITDGVLFNVPGGPRPEAVVTFSRQITAPEDQTLQIGIGADWFWRCSLNGRVVADCFTGGNREFPVQKGNHIVHLPVKRGINQLEIQVKSGAAGWSLAIGEIPFGYDARAEQVKKLLEVSPRPQDNCFQSFLPQDFFERLENGAFNGKLYPPAADRTAWEAVKTRAENRALVREVIDRAEEVLQEEIPPLVFSEYRRFILEGDRSGYEKLYFARRSNLGALVLAMALSNDRERYLAKAVDYVNAVLEEWTWCLPAHMSWDSRSRSPEKYWQCDLFASETALQLALTVNVIGDWLEAEWPQLPERIRKTALERAVLNPLSPETVWKNGWMHVEIPGNWTVWCGANLITAALILEDDRQRLSATVQAFLKGVSRFVWYYPEDGYCMEGPTYYGVAAGNLYRLCSVFERVMPGSMQKFCQNAKNRAIFEFIARTVVHSWLVSYGDAAPDAGAYRDSALLKSCGSALKSHRLLRIATGTLSLRGCTGNGSTLSRCLMALFDISADVGESPAEAEDEISFFPDRLAVFRSDILSAAMKAGDNGEYHNHNDLGHFSVWYRDMPLIIDAGAGTYTKQYFSSERYTLWNTRGKGHNAPVFDEIEQQEGRRFKAALSTVPGSENAVVCDLAQSYPQAAGVASFTRTMRFAPARVDIEDRMQLRQPRKVRIHLLCTVTPQVSSARRILLGGTALELENVTCVSREKICTPSSWSAVIPGCQITELVLEATAEQYRLSFIAPEQD